VVIFLWVWGTLDRYILKPVEEIVRTAIVQAVYDVKQVATDAPRLDRREFNGLDYHRVGDTWYVPLEVYETVETSGVEIPRTPGELYHRYVQLRYLRPHVVIPVFLFVFILLMYLVGRFITAGVGRFFWSLVEGGINRLPLVRNVYSSVKQVTDFVFTESEIQYTRVVAVEYPRLRMWSIGFVTGESLLDLHCVANETVLSVLIPTSPAPLTGYTVTVRKSETIDLDLTVEQAFQYLISCGVVVTPRQLPTKENFARLNRTWPPTPPATAALSPDDRAADVAAAERAAADSAAANTAASGDKTDKPGGATPRARSTA
jgi:uncharacterized membrane protein